MKKRNKKSTPKKSRVVKKSVKKAVTRKSSLRKKVATKGNKKKVQKAKNKSVKKTAKRVIKKSINKPSINKIKPKKKVRKATIPSSQTVTPSFKKRKDTKEELMEKPYFQVEQGKAKIKSWKNTIATDKETDALSDNELRSDMGEDEELKKRVWDVDMSGEDLDVPGSELDDEMEDIGAEDEENNPYSIGGDRHEDLDENEDLGR